MFITPAFADAATAIGGSADAAAAGGVSAFTSMLPIVLILFVFYFMVIRPQNKRLQDHRNMVNGLQNGDKVVTGGGLIATVDQVVGDDEVILKLADGVKVRAVRSTILTVRSKT
jgi:preprotein translocase subunit YajC